MFFVIAECRAEGVADVLQDVLLVLIGQASAIHGDLLHDSAERVMKKGHDLFARYARRRLPGVDKPFGPALLLLKWTPL